MSAPGSGGFGHPSGGGGRWPGPFGRVVFAVGDVMVAVFLTFALSGPIRPKQMRISSASRWCATRCSCG
jgi:hypothetical protein